MNSYFCHQTNPAFILNQMCKLSLKQAKDYKNGKLLNIITCQLLCALTLEAVLNSLGKEKFNDWGNFEKLSPKEKLHKITNNLDIDLTKKPFNLFHIIFQYRNDLAHAKPSTQSATKIDEQYIDGNGFPIIEKVPVLKAKWENQSNLKNAEKWLEAVYSICNILSSKTNLTNPILIGDITDIYKNKNL